MNFTQAIALLQSLQFSVMAKAPELVMGMSVYARNNEYCVTVHKKSKGKDKILQVTLGLYTRKAYLKSRMERLRDFINS